MKKFLLSLTVIVSFIFYSLYQKDQNGVKNFQVNQAVPINPSNTSSQTNRKTIMYKDGIYIGKVADAFYGNIQVKTTITNSSISDVVFMQYPNDRQESIDINQAAMPLLKQEAISAQSGQVDIISGATDSSKAFIESMNSALSQAQ